MATHSHPSNDVRASLQRRFTTDLGKMPTLTPIGQQPNQVVDPLDMSSTVCTNLLSYIFWEFGDRDVWRGQNVENSPFWGVGL